MEAAVLAIGLAACRAAGAVATLRGTVAILGVPAQLALFVALCCATLGAADPGLTADCGGGMRTGTVSGICGAVVGAFALGVTGANLQRSAAPASLPSFLTAVGVELLAGFVLALPVTLFAEMLILCGRLFDTVRGTQQAEQLIPSLEHRGGSFEALASLVAPLVIFSPPCDRLVFAAAQHAHSQSRALARALIDATGNPELPRGVILYGELLATAVTWLMPCIAAALFFDGLTSMLSRFIPRIAIATELVPLRIVALLLLLILLLRDNPDTVADIRERVRLAQSTDAVAHGAGWAPSRAEGG